MGTRHSNMRIQTAQRVAHDNVNPVQHFHSGVYRAQAEAERILERLDEEHANKYAPKEKKKPTIRKFSWE